MDRNNTNRQVADPSMLQQQQLRKKCHGNRRNQRFRKKCRALNVKPKKIEKMLKKRNRRNKQIQTTNNVKSTAKNHVQTNALNQGLIHNNKLMLSAPPPPTTMTTTVSNTTTTTMTHFNKRKRDISIQDLKQHTAMIPNSTSSISIAAQLSRKRQKITLLNNNIQHMTYRRPMYLQRASNILFQMLNKTLNYQLKIKDEKNFIYIRIDLLDQQYCVEVHQQLWQSYLDIGMQKRTWPDLLHRMTNTNDFDLCRQYLLNYVETIKKQLNTYQIELNKQQQTCPIKDLTIDQIDHGLKTFIHSQRKYLSIRNNKEIIQFKENISMEDFSKTFSTGQPTTNQNESLQRLITIRQEQMKIWEELLMLEQRVLCEFLPLNFNQMENFIAPLSYSPLVQKQKIIEFKNKHYKIVQEGKRHWLNIFFNAYEIKLQEYEQQFQNEFQQFENIQARDQTTTVDSSTLLKNSINEHMIRQTNQLKEDVYRRISSFRDKLIQNRQRSLTTKTTIGVHPEPYLDLLENPFTTSEWNQLSFGPSFIRLNQSILHSQKQQESEIKKEHRDIIEKVKKHLTSSPHSVPLTSPYLKKYSNDLLNYLHHCYFSPVPYKDQIQSLQQMNITAKIRQKIKQHQLILRQTDKSRNFYIGSVVEFEKKVQTFFQDTNAFIELSANPFDEIKNEVIELLNQLREKQLISKEQYDKMMFDRNKCELAHLYFNPKTHKDGIPVRPIENTIHAPTTNISNFLDKMIRPIFNEICHQTNIIDGNSFLNEMLKYTKKGLLKPSTLFCTFDIRNLYTMLPQEQTLNTLMDFLHIHGKTKIEGISLDTIRKLAAIVIKENVFVYGKKIYRQVLGGAMGSSLTLTLANIFMWEWQKELVRRQDISCEFYGRYIDDVFMTWNRSERDLIHLLENANQWHPNIKLDYKIGKSLPFLDSLLTNMNGTLQTSVYHKPTAEPYLVPFISDHSRHVFVNIIHNHLTHALRYSSTFEAFNYERRYIKLMLLYNGYPSTFIEREFRKYFQEYLPSTSLLSHVTNEQKFFPMRQKLFTQSTEQQRQQIQSVSTMENKNNRTHSIGKNQELETKQIKIENKLPIKFFIHHTYENRFQPMKRGLHDVHKEILNQSATKNVKMIVGNRNRRNATHELIRKRPQQSLLKNKPRKKKQMSKKTMRKHHNSTNQPTSYSFCIANSTQDEQSSFSSNIYIITNEL